MATRTKNRHLGFDAFETRQLMTGGNLANLAPVPAPPNQGTLAVERRLVPSVAAHGATPKTPSTAAYALATTETQVRTVHRGHATAGVHALSSRGDFQTTWTVTGKNVVGATLWRYNLEIDWSSDGKRITKSASHASGTIASGVPFWSYKGESDHWHQGGNGFSFVRVHSQGHFQYKLPKLGPIGGTVQDQYPVIDKVVNA
jgi:hypothetical protein